MLKSFMSWMAPQDTNNPSYVCSNCKTNTDEVYKCNKSNGCEEIHCRNCIIKLCNVCQNAQTYMLESYEYNNITASRTENGEFKVKNFKSTKSQKISKLNKKKEKSLDISGSIDNQRKAPMKKKKEMKRSDLEKLNTMELKEIVRNTGMPHSGLTKDELIETTLKNRRLRNKGFSDKKIKKMFCNNTIMELTNDQLKNLLGERGIPTSAPNKDVLLSRLSKHVN